MKVSESQLIGLIKECFKEVVQEVGGYGVSKQIDNPQSDVRTDIIEGVNNSQDYNYYIVNKKTRKIVYGYDYNGVEKADRDYYTAIDMEENGWDRKTYGLFSKPYLLKNGINPDDDSSWANN